MEYTHVDKPLRLGPVDIKNRIVRPAHVTMIGGGTINDELIAYHEARAKGGAALSIIEIMGVHSSSLGSLNSFDTNLDEMYPNLVNACHKHGMKVFQQLWHGGHNTFGPSLDGAPPISSSNLRGLHTKETPVPMSKSMIREIIASFVSSALKCVEWGVDGVEVHCAHGYLPAQFLSSAFNIRTDEYGGSLENRSRFILELLEAVRGAIPSNVAVGVRVAPDGLKGGAGVEEYQHIIAELERLNLVDYINISQGNYQTFPKMIGGMHEPAGYEMELSTQLTSITKLPTLVTGRFRTLEEADQVVRAGEADMVGMVRAMIADPDLVNKSLEDRAEDVRPCIGCNQACVAGIYKPVLPRLGCTVNPAVGHERTLSDASITPAEISKKVIIIGGGPAGMEAARVAASRGHNVSLYEAQKALGGKLRYAALAPTRAGILDIAIWQEEQLYKLGVNIFLNTFLDIEEAKSMNPDILILAVGATPRSDGKQFSNPGEPLNLSNGATIKTSVELFEEGINYEGRNVTVIDDLGEYETIACAEYLLSQGATVNYVTRHISFAPHAEFSLMTEPALTRLYGDSFNIMLRSRVTEFDGSTVSVLPTYVDSVNDAKAINSTELIYVSSGDSNVEHIGYDYEMEYDNLIIIGDARSSRSLVEAIGDGFHSALVL